MARILLIDDDQDMSIIVSDSLLAAGHEIECAVKGQDAKALLEKNRYDLLIVDWDLPDTTGLELCKDARAAGGTMPILMLTGRGHITDKEAGFEAGIDDYVTKPFELKELNMRVKALLRRAPAMPEVKSELQGPIGIGQVLAGKYRLDEYLTSGGMALVYKATNIDLGKPVVVKVAQAHLLGDQTIIKRFEQECRVMAGISHPNIATVFDAGMINDVQPYQVMEYIKGETLQEKLSRDGALPVPTALKIIIQACHGLEHVHAAGIVHRDIKPANIMLQDETERSDWVKILDFGLALLKDSRHRLTEANMIVGSAGYMAPENLTEGHVDRQGDVYALGVILFEMLTNDLPFSAPNTEAFYYKQLVEPPKLPSSKCADVAPGSKLDLIVERSVERDLAKRYKNVSEMRIDLEIALRSVTAS
jgi:serine/threonine protein kinase